MRESTVFFFSLCSVGMLSALALRQFKVEASVTQAPALAQVQPLPTKSAAAPQKSGPSLPDFSSWPELHMPDIFQHPVGPLGLDYSPSVKALDGKQVRVMGFMALTDWADQSLMLLCPHPIILHDKEYAACDEIPSGAVLVRMPPGEQAAYAKGLFMLAGTLRLGRTAAPGERYLWATLELHPQAKHWTPSPALLSAYTPQHREQLDRLLVKQRHCTCRSCQPAAALRNLLPLKKTRENPSTSL
jgi:hypothetical protein